MEIDLEDDMGLSWVHFLAGAAAGTVEHCGMFPLDTVKVCLLVNGIFYTLVQFLVYLEVSLGPFCQV